MVNQTRSYGKDLKNQIVAIFFLKFILKFDMIFIIIKEANNISILFIDKLIGLLLVHE